MKTWPAIRLAILSIAAAALLAPAQAAELTVVTVNAPAINCVFNASCTMTVTDSLGSLQFTPYGAGARLQSRTFAALPGTPGAGMTAYLYRVDLTRADGFTECLAGMVIDFGPVAQLPYVPNNPAHVYVVTQGGLGSVGVKSAEQDGDVITFNFNGYLCAGQSSFFFGLAASKPPQPTSATLFGIGKPPIIQTDARAPQH